MQNLAPLLSEDLQALGLSIPEAAQQQLLALLALLEKWNKAYNLTNITEPQAMLSHHLIDSLSILPYLQGQHIIDVGTGAGFPGLPLAIAAPDKAFTLIDSTNKKIQFVQHAALTLGLENVTPVHSRVEEYTAPALFDTAIARAVSDLSSLAKLTKHLLNPDGTLLAMKGQYPKDELQNVADHAKVVPLKLPRLDVERHLVCLQGI